VRAWRRGDKRRAGRFLTLAILCFLGPAIGASCGNAYVRLDAPEIYFYHNDFLGTPQRLTNNNPDDPKVVWAARYEPFGQAQIDDDVDDDGTPVVNPLRFPGQYDDDWKRPWGGVGPYYNMARYYDPAIGRYTQVDPVLEQTMEVPQGALECGGACGPLSYGYGRNNPLKYVDPSGLYWIDPDMPWDKANDVDMAVRRLQRVVLPSNCAGTCISDRIRRALPDARFHWRPKTLWVLRLCGFSYPATLSVWLGNTSWQERADQCGPLWCTILHEMTHAVQGYLSEARPREVERSCGCP